MEPQRQSVQTVLTSKPRILVNYCQTCNTADSNDCKPKQAQGTLEQAPPTPPSGPFVLPEEGVLQEPTPPPSGPAAPLQEGVVEQPPADQGAAELPPPTTEETQPATVEEEQPVPVCQEGLEFNEDLGFCVPEDCPEGQVFDEESSICVLEELEATEEPAQPEPEEEQPSEESDSGDDNNN
jgi:hypothetical protein